MTIEQTPRNLDQQLMAMRIIVVALTMGVVGFAAVAFLMRQEKAPADDLPLIAWIGLGLAGFVFLVRAVISASMVGVARKRIIAGIWKPDPRVAIPTDLSELDQLLLLHQQRLIVRAAMLEGAAFFNAVAFMLNGQLWSLGVAGTLAAINLSTFPTRDSVLGWIGQQLELIQLEREHSQSNS